MRITLKKSSTGVAYFPGLAKAVVLDSSTLPQSEAMELERLVEAAEFFDQSDKPPSMTASGAADFQEQSVTIERENDVRTVYLSDLKMKSAAMQSLLSFVDQKANK